MLKSQLSKFQNKISAAKTEYDTAAARLDELRQRLKACDSEIGALAADKASLTQEATDLAVNKKKLQHKYNNISLRQLHWFPRSLCSLRDTIVVTMQ